MTNAVRIVLNYKDYEALPNDGRKYEIHEGELSVTPAPTPQHQRFSRELFRILDAHVRQRELGEVFYAPIDVIFADTSIVQPDLVYLTSEQSALVTSRGIEGAPTLLVEILSPSTAQIDRHTKLQLYARHGVPHYWIVDGETRSIEAYALADGRYVLDARGAGDARFTARPFLDLEIALASLWP
jgi:Uma2 family endonuclease